LTDRTPYTYLIGWSSANKWYYGVRYSKGCDPSELWKTYFTSSNHVKKFRQINGDPDIIQIRKTFNCVNKARIWEHKVLKRLNVISKENFINKTDNISFSVESSLKGSLKSTNKGQKRPHLSKINSEKTGSLNHMWGRNKELSPRFGIKGEKHPMYGKTNINASNAAKIRIECPFCNKTGNIANMKRWHFNNCKINNNKKGE
jgi:hypothetical protein